MYIRASFHIITGSKYLSTRKMNNAKLLETLFTDKVTN